MPSRRFATQWRLLSRTPDAAGEQRFVTLGMDALGRVLVVIHTQRGERTRVISARKASRGETEQYHA